MFYAFFAAAAASLPVGESRTAIILPQSSLSTLATSQGQHQFFFANSQGIIMY